MDKKSALITLIKHTVFLSEEVKTKLLSKVDSLSEEEIHTIGKFLALEKKHGLEATNQQINQLDEVLKILEKDVPPAKT